MSVASESFWESTFIDQNNPKRQTADPPMEFTEAGPILRLTNKQARREADRAARA